MKCDGCHKDKNYFTELHSVPRLDTTPNCYSVFHPQRPRKLLLCKPCLEKRDKNLQAIGAPFPKISTTGTARPA